jgi:hypothetical protein
LISSNRSVAALSAAVKRVVPILVGAGLLFRLLFLGKRQLWTAELMQAVVIRGSSAGEILARLRAGMALPAPLDYFIQKAFAFVLDESPWSLRIHAVIFGTLSLWIFYRIARMLFDERVALYSTLLMTFFPLHYHYSQEGRPYALFFFLTLVSFDLLLRKIYRKDGGAAAWLLLAGVLVLALYSSLLAVFVIVTQWIALVAAAIRRPKEPEDPRAFPLVEWRLVLQYTVAAVGAAILFVPWLRFAWHAPHMATVSEVAHPRLILRLVKELGDNSYPMSALIIAGAWTGARALRRHGRGASLQWLLLWAGVTIVPLLVAEIVFGYFFAIRHILHATPALVLLAGYGLSYVGERLTILDHLPYQMSAPCIAYAGLTVIMSIGIAAWHWRSEPIDWRGTATQLRETLHQGDVVAMPGMFVLLEYYAPSLENYRVDDLSPGPGFLNREGTQRRFVVCLDSLRPDPCAQFRAATQRDTAWRRQQLRGFTVWVREKQP